MVLLDIIFRQAIRGRSPPAFYTIFAQEVRKAGATVHLFLIPSYNDYR